MNTWKLLVVKKVSFIFDYTIPTTQHDYLANCLPNGYNAVEELVENGWLKVCKGKMRFKLQN